MQNTGEQGAAQRECEFCGHETDAADDKCSFCGAPRLRRNFFSGRAGEALKWVGLLLLVALIFKLSALA